MNAYLTCVQALCLKPGRWNVPETRQLSCDVNNILSAKKKKKVIEKLSSHGKIRHGSS